MRALLILTLTAGLAHAEVPYDLALPLDCAPGRDCWPVRYVDHDPGPGVRDYHCGDASGDGHKGTDFAIPDLAAMATGVPVLAARAGVVDAVRDGAPDTGVDRPGRELAADQACGNGIRLDHGDGWATWYCHLRRGSLRVIAGDQVEAGQPLALVGLSGDTSFPHLHFEVRKEARIVDPFLGLDPPGACRMSDRPLWSADAALDLDYLPLVQTRVGFAGAPVEPEDVRKGWHLEERLPATIPVLVLWSEAYGVRAGDRVRFRIRQPDGSVLLNKVVRIETDRARWVGFAGTRRDGTRWPEGRYTGEVTLERGDTAARLQSTKGRDIFLR